MACSPLFSPEQSITGTSTPHLADDSEGAASGPSDRWSPEEDTAPGTHRQEELVPKELTCERTDGEDGKGNPHFDDYFDHDKDLEPMGDELDDDDFEPHDASSEELDEGLNVDDEEYAGLQHELDGPLDDINGNEAEEESIERQQTRGRKKDKVSLFMTIRTQTGVVLTTRDYETAPVTRGALRADIVAVRSVLPSHSDGGVPPRLKRKLAADQSVQSEEYAWLCCTHNLG